MEKDNYIDKAMRIFKEVSQPEKNHYTQKFKYLPMWLNECAHYFELESKKQLPYKHYYYYKRGSVIRVNFGVNEGSEFSNIHFAVVLDKKDAPQKGTLTVIPLTSKGKSGRFSLGKEIFNQTNILLSQRQIQLDNKRKKLEDELTVLKLKNNTLLEKDKEYREHNDKFIKKVKAVQKEAYKKKDDKGLYREILTKVSYLDNEKESLSQEKISISNKLYELKKLIPELEKKMNEYSSEIKQLEQVNEIYEKYNKNTFARIEDITTISKLRIKRINQFDPSGEIRSSSEQMKAISDKMIQLYASK